MLGALGAVLAEDVISPMAVPLDANSAMDGYAIRAVDAGAISLPVSQRIAAGHTGSALEPGTAARIFTGAAVPLGADTVVMQEDCELQDDGSVRILCEVRCGQHVRPRGQDIEEGQTVLSRGRRLRAQDLGLLASVGYHAVQVYRPLRIAVLSTGDELVEPGSADLRSGQLYNSNRYTLAGLIGSLGMEFVDGGIVPDQAELTGQALLRAAEQADVVVTSGGVSVGEEDHVKTQVERHGQFDLWKLAIKPGKPLAFGRIGATPFIGLPGNPTSVYVTFNLVARPFLLKMQGQADSALPVLTARAEFSIDKPGLRQDYQRVRLERAEGALVAQRFGNQSSGVLSSVSYSDALAVIRPGQTLARGDEVEIILLDLL